MTKKLVPDPPVPSPQPDTGPTLISFEDQLVHAWDLLRCAAAAADEYSGTLEGKPRTLAMASVHLIFQAQAVLEQMIEHLPRTPGSLPET